MISLTRIPEAGVYLPYIFIFLTFGSFTLSVTIHQRLTSRLRFNPLQSNNLWNTLLILIGMFTVTISKFISLKGLTLFFGILAGAVLSFLIFKLELRANRYFSRKLMVQPSKTRLPHKNGHSGSINQNAKMSALLSGKPSNGERIGNLVRQRNFTSYPSFNLTDLIACAIIEEVLYRGFVLILLLNIFSSPFTLIAIVIQAFFFGLIHQFYGWYQCLNKVIMGLILGGIVLVTKNLFIAIFTHIFFNIMAHYYTEARIKNSHT